MRERRSSQRRRLTARLPVLLLALAAALAALLLGGVGVGQAQTAVSLIEVEGGGTQIGFEGERALGIETAASAGAGFDGWVVTEVELRIRPDDGTGAIRTATPPGLAICESDNDGDPSGTCFHLTAPRRVQIPAGTTTGQEVTYTAPGYGHFLTTGSNYTLHFTENGSFGANGVHNLDASDNDGEAVFVAGSFRNAMRELKGDGTWGSSSTNVAWARITGYASETPVASEVDPNLPSLEQVSNLGQNIATEEVALGTTRVVQGFTTGPHLYGYTLADIKVKLKNDSASAVTTPVTMSLLTGSLSGNGGPLTGRLVASLTGPSTIPANSTANYSFTAATTVTLDRKATYDVLLEGGTADIIVKLTASDNEDAAGQRGWSFGDLAYKMTQGLGTIFTEVDDSVLMSVNGAINPTLPRTLVSNIGHSATDFLALTTFDLAQPFTVGSHDAGYRLTSIDIRVNTGTSGTTTPTLTLHSVSGAGTKVADFTGPSALDANTIKNYTFRPTTSVTLDASDEYWLVVQGSGLVRPETSPSDAEDGTPLDGASIGNAAHSRSASSTGAFAEHDANTPVLKIRVRGVRLNSAATGVPRISAPNVFRVPAVLTADISRIADGNGITNIASRASYTWQRFTANGRRLEAANIGTGDTYKLTDADAGKRIKVLVSFQDSDGYSEGPLTSDATGAIGAAASCRAPTYVGGATQLGPARKVGIARFTFSGTTSYGFAGPTTSDFVGTTNIGTLDNATFTTATSNDHEIYYISDSTLYGLLIGFDTGLSAVDRSKLVLHVCDANAFRFSSVDVYRGTDYQLTVHTPGWWQHAERTIYLSEDTAAPTLVEATVNGTSLVMTFNEELGAAASLVNSAFTVKKTPSGGSETTLTLGSTAPSISGSTVTLTLATASAVTATDTDVKVLYTRPETGTANKLVDTFRNETATFTADQDVGNLLVPRVSIERVYDDASPFVAFPEFRVTRSSASASALTVNIAITQDETYVFPTAQTITIPANQTSATAQFFVNYTGRVSGNLTATVVGGSGYVPADAPDDSATVEMKVLSSGLLVTVALQQTAYSVEEGDSVDVTLDMTLAAGTAEPRRAFGTVALSSVEGTAENHVDYPAVGRAIIPSPDDWTASGGGYTATKTFTIQTTEDQANEGDETFTVRLDATPGAPASLFGIVPGAGTATITIVDNDTLEVSSVAATSTPTGGYYGATDTIEFTVTFNGNVTLTGAPQFAFDLGGATRQAAYASGSDSEELVFSYTVAATDANDHDGISWGANALSLNGGTIKFMHTEAAQQVAADLDHAAQAALPGHKVDAAKPTFVEASVNGTTLTLTFSEDLDTTAAPANSAFTVKKGSGGTEQTLSGTVPSISGSTVTLTLATAVTATDTDVKVAYTKPSTNPLKDLSGKEVDTFGDQDVTNELADSVPPELAATDAAVLAADGVTLTLTYNEALKTASVPAVAAFTVKATPAGGSEAVLALASSGGVTVSGSTVVLKLAVPITHNDGSVKVSYEKPGTGAVIEDANGNDAADFTDRAVTNNSTAPRVSIERVYADASSRIANPVFRIRRSNTATANLHVELSLTQTDTYVGLSDTSTVIASGKTEAEFTVDLDYPGNTNGDLTVTVTEGAGYAPALAPNDAATVAIKAPAAGRPLTVVHDQADWTVDEGDNARVTMTLTLAGGLADPRDDYDLFIDLETGSATAQEPGGSGGDFIVPATGARTPVLASGWTARSGGGFTQTVTLEVETVEDTEPEGEETFRAVFNVSSEDGAIEYPALPDPNADPTPPNDRESTITITDDDPLVVTDVKVSSTPTGGYYGVGATIKFTVTFNGAVSVTGMPQFAFELAGQTRQAAYTGEDEDAAQTFEYTVASTDADDHDGISWGANAVGLNGGAITLFVKDGTPPDAGLDHAAQAALPGQKVDAAKPAFVEASVNGTTLTVTFSEDLDTTAAPANSAFTVKKGSGGTEQTLSSTVPSISGSTVTLTLATAVTATDTDVKVAYTKPSANPLKDLSGKEVDTFGDEDVFNELADSVPPELAATDAAVLAADGLTLTLTYNEALKTASVPAVAAFTVKATPAGGSEAVVALASSGGVTVSGSTVVLKLAVPITHNDGSVKVSYEKPGTGAVIEDANGNDAADFTDRAVTNNSVAPRVSIERVYADASPGIAHAEFRVTRSNTSANALTVNIEITQADTYLASTTETITIPANATSMTEQFESYYEGNTSGDLTATVSGGDGYVPAVAPNNAATVRMKAPSSGRTLTIAHQQGAYSVTEGSDWSVTVTFSTGVGVAQPRQDVQAGLVAESGTAISGSGNDFRTYGTTVTVAASDWTAAGGAFTATKAVMDSTLQDDEYEGSEQFDLVLHRPNPLTVPAFFSPTCPPGTPDGTDCLATITIIDDDTLEVTDVEVTSTPTGGYYDPVEDIDFTATLNGKVNVTGTPRFAFELGGETRSAAYTLGASGTTELVFRYVVATGDDDHDGVSWGANALSLDGGTIKFMHTDAAQQVNANLNHAAQGALPGQKVDTTKPSLEEAEVDGATLSMFFSEELNTAAPANSAFTVKVDAGTGANPTAVSISGSVVTLTLATAVTQEQTVTVSYTSPASNKIRDLSGKEADAFTDRTVDPASDIANFRATPGNRRVRLEWDNPGDSTIQRYQYRLMNTSDGAWNPDWRSISGSNANTTAITATGLRNGIEYTFQVRPLFLRNQLQTMGKEGEIKSVPRGPLVASRNLAAASAGDGEIALSWDDPGDITITGYQYRYRNPSDSGWNPDWTDMSGSSATTTSHTLSGLTNNVLYTLEVRSLRGVTGGPAARATQQPRGPIVVPANFAAASGEDRRATLSWDNSGDDSISRFQYRYRISTVSAWNPDWTDIPGSRWNTTSYTVRSLVNLIGYTFELRALRGTLEGPASSDTATPEGPPSVPLPPQGLTVHPADRSLGLSWDPPVSEDSRAPVTGYRVRYREEGRSWRTVSRPTGLLGWQTIAGLRNGSAYEVQVASVNSVGAGAWTETRGVPEAPQLGEPPPQPVGNEAFDVGQLGVWWEGTDPGGNFWGNDRQMDSCAGTYAFTVIWSGPADDRNAEEWAAHIAPSGHASMVNYSFRRSPDTQGDYYEMNGTMRLDGAGAASIRVRGRYGSTWGEWSPPAGLYCFENR